MLEERYHHFAHLKDIKVKVGDWVRKGQVIATMGNTGKSTAAHLHWEIQKILRSEWTTYTGGLNENGIKNFYENPQTILNECGVLPVENGIVSGYGWLDDIDNGLIHPGWDLNVSGTSGNQDEGEPILAPEDGEVIYLNYGYSSGWGNHLFIKSNDKIMLEEIEKLKTYVYDYHEKNLSLLNKIVGELQEVDKKYKKEINKLKKNKAGKKKQKKQTKNIMKKVKDLISKKK